MAGLGYKNFSTGDVLTAGDVDNYLMEQTVMVFASSAARTTALAAVLAEGMVSYLADTNVVEVYNGSAWASLDDPNAIQNTIVDAKGDLIGATAADTPARLAVGTNGQVLTADSTAATGLAWATASASGLTLIKTQTIGSAVTSVTVTSAFSSTYDNYLITVSGGVGSVNTLGLNMTLGSTATGYYRFLVYGAYTANTVNGLASANATAWNDCGYATTNTISLAVNLFNPNLAKRTLFSNIFAASNTTGLAGFNNGYLNDATQYTAFTIGTGGADTLTGGTIRVYGYQNS